MSNHLSGIFDTKNIGVVVVIIVVVVFGLPLVITD